MTNCRILYGHTHTHIQFASFPILYLLCATRHLISVCQSPLLPFPTFSLSLSIIVISRGDCLRLRTQHFKLDLSLICVSVSVALPGSVSVSPSLSLPVVSCWPADLLMWCIKNETVNSAAARITYVWSGTYNALIAVAMASVCPGLPGSWQHFRGDWERKGNLELTAALGLQRKCKWILGNSNTTMGMKTNRCNSQVHPITCVTTHGLNLLTSDFWPASE